MLDLTRSCASYSLLFISVSQSVTRCLLSTYLGPGPGNSTKSKNCHTLPVRDTVELRAFDCWEEPTHPVSLFSVEAKTTPMDGKAEPL